MRIAKNKKHLLSNLRDLRAFMGIVAASLREVYPNNKKVLKHSEELTGAADQVATWIDGIKSERNME